MNIVLIGAGKLGLGLTEALSYEGHDLTVIDTNTVVLNALTERFDVLTVNGNGASTALQREAGADKSDLLIATTRNDEVNLLCCMVARKLGCKHTIARVRNTEYQEAEYLLREELALSMAVNPEMIAAREIYSLLHYPAFSTRELFAKGRAEIVAVNVEAEGIFDGTRLSDLYRKIGLHILICGVKRGTEVFIPHGDFTLKAGDLIYVTAPAQELSALSKKLHKKEGKIKNGMIVGGSRIAVNLARLLAEAGIKVKIIEKDHDKALKLDDMLPYAEIRCNDGSSFEVLNTEGITETDSLIALTDIDEQNVIAAAYGNSLGINKVVAKVTRGDIAAFLSSKGDNSIVSPASLAISDVLRYVRAMQNSTEDEEIVALHRLADDKIEALEFRANSNTRYLNTPLNECPIIKGILIAVISHQGRIVIPNGSDTICPRDSVVIIAPRGNKINSLNDIFQG